MADFKPDLPYIVPAFLFIPTETVVKGVKTKTYADVGERFNCSFRTFGGTEKNVNDTIALEDTATIETFYTPTIQANCRIQVDNDLYEVIGTPENVRKQNKTLIIKVKAIKGGA